MEIGTIGECVYTVKKEDLASEIAFGAEDSFPEVYATSRMIALMEVSAARMMKPLLQPGQLSVGVGVDIKHFAPTPVGEEVRAVARYHGLDGKIHQFTIDVFDKAGKVASGQHSRAIVMTEKLVEAARLRMANAVIDKSSSSMT